MRVLALAPLIPVSRELILTSLRELPRLHRAVYGNPRFVVLDEPNSNLDLDGEAALIEALKHLKENETTVIVIAHRPSVLRHVDKLLVLKDGQVQKMGPRDEVFAEITPSRSQKPQSPGKISEVKARRLTERLA